MRLFAVLLLATGLPAAAGTIHLTCHDGGDAVGRGFGRHFRSAAFCDLDARCDGICTFSLNPSCLQCNLGRGCPSPDSYYEACADHADFPCPSTFPMLAIPTRPGRPLRVGRRCHRLRVVLTCLAAADCPSPSTTTTLPPGLSDLTGDWTITNTVVADTCPPAVAARFAAPTHSLRLAQQGTLLLGCVDGSLFSDGGAVTSSSFDLDTGNHLEIIAPGSYDYGFSRHLSGTLPATSGQTTVMQRWTFTPGPSAPPGEVPCARTVGGVMTPIAPACGGDADCIEREPCARCVGGACRWLPDCGYEWTRWR